MNEMLGYIALWIVRILLFYYCWNYIVPDLFILRTITLLDAFILTVMVDLLFNS